MGRDASSFIRNLLRSLPDGQFYAANLLQQVQGVPNDTNVYRIFEMYAQEFASGSAVLEQLRMNLNLASCSIDSLWNNFGCYLGPQKIFEQDWETDLYPPLSGSIISYRKQLRFLLDAALAGSSVYALERVCQAFTGMSPVINQYSYHPRWKLKVESGSITGVSGSLGEVMIDGSKSWYNEEWAGAILQVPSGSLGAPASSSMYYVDRSGPYWLASDGMDFTSLVGQTYIVGFSKLGHTTKLYGRDWAYNALEVNVWMPPGIPETRKVDLVTAANSVRPADARLRFKWQTTYEALTTVAQFNQWTYTSGSFCINADGSMSNLITTLS